MNAQEMFEKLGYTKFNSDENLSITYLSNEKIIIQFHIEKRIYSKYSIPAPMFTLSVDYLVDDITIKEHQAITQQMKELGWIK